MVVVVRQWFVVSVAKVSLWLAMAVTLTLAVAVSVLGAVFARNLPGHLLGNLDGSASAQGSGVVATELPRDSFGDFDRNLVASFFGLFVAFFARNLNRVVVAVLLGDV